MVEKMKNEDQSSQITKSKTVMMLLRQRIQTLHEMSIQYIGTKRVVMTISK